MCMTGTDKPRMEGEKERESDLQLLRQSLTSILLTGTRHYVTWSHPNAKCQGQKSGQMHLLL